MKITVFQALTLLAEKYKNNQEIIYNKVKNLYLSGVRTEQDKNILNQLLNDSSLHDYEITQTKKDINEDPTRRYFESHLCHETLKHSLDDLDADLLVRNFNYIISNVSLHLRLIVEDTLYNNKLDFIINNIHKNSKSFNQEIKFLKEKESFNDLKHKHGNHNQSPDTILKNRKKKLLILQNCNHAASTAVNIPNNNLPLNLYPKTDYVFDPKNRGRTERNNSSGEKQLVETYALGIMRNYMPLAVDDSLFSHRTSNRVRASDASNYVEDAQQVEYTFENKVTPFVNSISGTILCQLRVFAKQCRDGEFVYSENPEQLKLYFKTLLSYILYNSGAHSLDEFMRVLQLPEVIEEFKNVPGFSDITLDNIFKNENKMAFEEALNKTISYNNSIVYKKAIQEEIVAKINDNLNDRTDLKFGRINEDIPVYSAKNQLNITRTSSLFKKPFSSLPSVRDKNTKQQKMESISIIKCCS